MIICLQQRYITPGVNQHDIFELESCSSRLSHYHSDGVYFPKYSNKEDLTTISVLRLTLCFFAAFQDIDSVFLQRFGISMYVITFKKFNAKTRYFYTLKVNKTFLVV